MKPKAEKLPKGVDETFIDTVNAASTDELKSTIVRLQIQNDENEQFKQSDEYLEHKETFDQAREVWNEVYLPVKDVTVAIKNKTKVVIERLKEKGAI